MDVGADL